VQHKRRAGTSCRSLAQAGASNELAARRPGIDVTGRTLRTVGCGARLVLSRRERSCLSSGFQWDVLFCQLDQLWAIYQPDFTVLPTLSTLSSGALLCYSQVHGTCSGVRSVRIMRAACSECELQDDGQAMTKYGLRRSRSSAGPSIYDASTKLFAVGTSEASGDGDDMQGDDDQAKTPATRAARCTRVPLGSSTSMRVVSVFRARRRCSTQAEHTYLDDRTICLMVARPVRH
jgi:hypothetical protein